MPAIWKMEIKWIGFGHIRSRLSHENTENINGLITNTKQGPSQPREAQDRVVSLLNCAKPLNKNKF